VAYKVPTLEEMLGFLIALGKGLLPTRNFGSRFVPGWKLLKIIAGAATDGHAHIVSAFDAVFPTRARGAALDEWLGLIAPGGSKLRKGATGARKANAGRVRGSNGSTFTAGDQLIHRKSNQLYQLGESGTIVAPVPGYVDADIVAVSTGAATRLEKGEVLEFLAPPTGIKTQVELQLTLDEDGVDAEQDGSAQNRLLLAMGTPRSGGNQADFVGWALLQLGVAQAFCYPNRAGVGTVDIAALHQGTGSARILLAGEVTALIAALRELAPTQMGATGGALRGLTVIAETANVELTITPDGQAQNAMDYDDIAGPAQVLTWNGTTRALQFNAARPSTMKAGDRICIKGVASTQDSAPMVIEALSSTDTVILQTIPKKPDGTDATPAATDLVYAGGPLTVTVRAAVLAHLNGDTLYAGPAGPLPAATAASSGIDTTHLEVLAEGIGTANPGGLYGAWNGGLLLSVLAKIGTFTKGVRKQTVVTPVLDQEATDYPFPNDVQIGLLVPGYILVRRG
jgi:uncharacterized phage protein gp47/JayE